MVRRYHAVVNDTDNIEYVYSNAPRIPPSQHWWLGGLGEMSDWKAWRGTGIGEAGRGRTQQISSKHWSKAIENLLMFY